MPSRTDLVNSITRVAAQNHAVRSTFVNGVSRHQMPTSVSFATLRAMMTAATGQTQRTFVGTVDGDICVSINFNYEALTTPPAPTAGRKRGRDHVEEAVEAAVTRVKKGLQNNEACTDEMLNNAHEALCALLKRLRGADGESVVESWGLSFKKPEPAHLSNGHANGAVRPRLILSVRLSPSVAVPVPSLFQCLGLRCSADGMLTTQDSDALAPGFDLPLSEQARTAETHGQRAITLFATVAQNLS